KNSPDWSGYPAQFQSSLQNSDARLGYLDRTSGYPHHEQGWYAEGKRVKYDWQDISVQNPVGLVLESKDSFDNKSTIEYDEYRLLPIAARQYYNATDYLETTAQYDYRSFQPLEVKDPNDNISVFDYSPLGLLRATALIGKGTEGDYKAATGTFYEKY